MDFNTFSQKIYAHLLSLDETSPIFLKSLLSYSSILEKNYPNEFKSKLKEIGILEIMDKMVEHAGEMVKLSDSFHLNPIQKTIEISLGEEQLVSPLIDLKSYLSNDLGLVEKTEDYFIALSYLSRLENYELFQITHAIILK